MGNSTRSIGVALAMWVLLHMLGLLAFAQDRHEEALFTIAVQAHRDGLYDLAHTQLQQYLTTYPNGERLSEVHYLLGDYSYRKGEYARATEHLREALQRGPKATFRDDARYLLGRSHFERGRYHEAAQTLQPLLNQGRSGYWYEAALYWTGEALLSAGDFDAAASALEQLVTQFPASAYLAYALYSLGYAWQKVNADEQALDAFQRVIQRFPYSKVRHSAEYGVARALLSLKRYAEAASHWDRLRMEAPNPERAAEATYWWAESWAQAGSCEHARSAFHVYLEQFSQGRHRADALWAIGECAYASGDSGEAVARFEELLQHSPAYPRRETLLLHLADAYYREGQLVKARHIYTHWLPSFPNSPRRVDVLIRHGLLSHAQEDYIQSAQDFSEVLRLTPDPSHQTLAHQMLGESYFRRHECAAALPSLTAVIRAWRALAGGQGSAPQGPGSQSSIAVPSEIAAQQARFRRGVCAYRQQQYAAAVADLGPLADAPDFHEDRQTLLLLLGQSLATLDRHTEAVVRYQQALEAGPSDSVLPEVLASLGKSLLKIGHVERALHVYEQLLSASPNLSGKERLHLQLALLYRERRARALETFHLRMAIAGGEPAVSAQALYYLADLLLQAGAGEEGRALLQKLITQFSSQARWVGFAYYRLALLYEEDQGWREAWTAYVAAAKTATDPKLVMAARGRAKHLEETVDVHPRREPTE